MFSRINIYGLGLIGGSLAKAIKHMHPKANIRAWDLQKDAIIAATQDNVICGSFDGDNSHDVLDCELLLLCAPIAPCIKLLTQIAPHATKSTIISDVCSTKAELLSKAQELTLQNPVLTFIGGHPMAGSEKSGYTAASPHLFQNAIYILCPITKNDAADSSTINMESFIRELGALPMQIPWEMHDFYMACISHLPHVAASALVNAAHAYEDEKGTLRTLAAGGFKDLTRIASGDAGLWRGILHSNRDNVITLIDAFRHQLDLFSHSLKTNDSQGMQTLLTDAATYRDSFQTSSRTINEIMFELSVDVEDKPGVIADISKILSSKSINMRNLYIAESREMENGCLRLAFDSQNARNAAFNALDRAGYLVNL